MKLVFMKVSPFIRKAQFSKSQYPTQKSRRTENKITASSTAFSKTTPTILSTFALSHLKTSNISIPVVKISAQNLFPKDRSVLKYKAKYSTEMENMFWLKLEQQGVGGL